MKCLGGKSGGENRFVMIDSFCIKESLTKILSNNGGKTRRVDRLIQKEISARKRAPPSLTIKV